MRNKPAPPGFNKKIHADSLTDVEYKFFCAACLPVPYGYALGMALWSMGES